MTTLYVEDAWQISHWLRQAAACAEAAQLDEAYSLQQRALKKTQRIKKWLDIQPKTRVAEWTAAVRAVRSKSALPVTEPIYPPRQEELLISQLKPTLAPKVTPAAEPIPALAPIQEEVPPPPFPLVADRFFASVPPESMSARSRAALALEDLGASLPTRLLIDYVNARDIPPITPSALSALRRDERRAFDRSGRTDVIAPALDGQSFVPLRGRFVLAAWPQALRLVGPLSEQADYLTAMQRLAWLTRAAQERGHPAFARLNALLWRNVRPMLGRLRGSEVSLDRVDEIVGNELTFIAARDHDWRCKAAQRARSELTLDERIWGRQPGE